jgi:hypothetical protein
MASSIEIMRAALDQRCRQIVTVFNGLLDLEIDSKSVLEGAISGDHALLHSFQRQTLSAKDIQAYRHEMGGFLPGSTWLEIEDGQEAYEMRWVFESANLLVWHELCQLADPKVVSAILRMVQLPIEKRRLAHAREIVIDALAFEMGRSLYAHPVSGQAIPRSVGERCKLMCDALVATSQRLCLLRRQGEPDLNQKLFILRIWGELQTHALNGSDPTKKALFQLEQTWGLILKKDNVLKEAYATLYGCALSMADVANLAFRESPSAWESCESEDHSAARVYH